MKGNDEGKRSIAGQEVKAIEGDTEDVDFLGRLFWYTIGESLAPINKITDFVAKEKLDKELLPNPPKQKVAWRRAMRDMERKLTIKAEEEIEAPEYLVNFIERSDKIKLSDLEDEEMDRYVAEYMVRKLDKDTFHLVREIRRPDEDRLDYTELIEWQYVNDQDRVAWKPLTTKDQHRNMGKMHKEMMEKKQKYEESANEYDIRKRVNEFLDGEQIITLKSSGGVYFIPEKNQEIIQEVKKLLDQINEWSTGGFRSELWQVPVISTEEQKDLIENGVKQETVKFADKKMKEIKQILQNDEEISKKKYHNLIEELKDVKERKQEYEEIIGRNLDTCEEQVNIMKKQIRKLSDNVKDAEPTTLNDFEEKED